MKWEPIETAPKDGSDILVASPDIDPCVAYWYAGMWFCGYDQYGNDLYRDVTLWTPITPPSHDGSE